MIPSTSISTNNSCTDIETCKKSKFKSTKLPLVIKNNNKKTKREIFKKAEAIRLNRFIFTRIF